MSAGTHTLSHRRYRLINIHTEASLDMKWVGIGRGEGGAMGLIVNFCHFYSDRKPHPLFCHPHSHEWLVNNIGTKNINQNQNTQTQPDKIQTSINCSQSINPARVYNITSEVTCVIILHSRKQRCGIDHILFTVSAKWLFTQLTHFCEC